MHALQERLDDVAARLSLAKVTLRNAQGTITDVGQTLQDENIDLEDLLPTLRGQVMRITQSIRIVMTQLADAENDVQRPARAAWAPADEYPWPW